MSAAAITAAITAAAGLVASIAGLVKTLQTAGLLKAHLQWHRQQNPDDPGLTPRR